MRRSTSSGRGGPIRAHELQTVLKRFATISGGRAFFTEDVVAAGQVLRGDSRRSQQSVSDFLRLSGQGARRTVHKIRVEVGNGRTTTCGSGRLPVCARTETKVCTPCTQIVRSHEGCDRHRRADRNTGDGGARAAAWRRTRRNSLRPRSGSAVDLVPVDVSIIGDDGQPRDGLTAKDFALDVDGRPRRIVSAQYVSSVRENARRPRRRTATFSSNAAPAAAA